MTRIVVWGLGGFAREVNFLCEQLGVEVVGFLHEDAAMKGRTVDDVPVLGSLADIASLRKEVSVLCAGVADPGWKKHLFESTFRAGFEVCPALVHPSVHVSKRNSIGPGSVICAGVIMTVNVHIGAHVAVNLQSTLGHDVVVGDYATIAPGVNLSGSVTVGEGVFIGTNAAVLEKTHVHAWSVIGAGAFVRQDVPERVLFAGVPATLKKRLP
jgi:sugar O-acyltransferase (sialic acid O-acetyltransferase NeuD family)